jgi:peroxiredoxin
MSAADFELPDTDGSRHSLRGQEAPATIVYWTCNHCPYALAWEDRMHAVSRDYAERGVRTLAINSNDAERYPADSPAAMAERVADEDWPHPYLHDENQVVARAWGAERTPHIYVLDSDLEVRYEGAPDGDYEDESRDAEWVRGALDAILAGEDVVSPRTDAVGCSIKWR